MAKKKKNTARNVAIGAGVLAAGLLLLLGTDANAESADGDRGDGGEGPGDDLPDVDDLPQPQDDPLGPDTDEPTPPDTPDPDPPGPQTPPLGFVAPGGGDGGGPDDLSPNPPSPEPEGPDPDFEHLPDFYNPDYPDPGKFYQVTAGRDSKGLFDIAYRWRLASLFLAAKNAGGLSDDEARDWAAARVGSNTMAGQGVAVDYILCAAWNDILYGSNTVAAHNRRGPHGRGIDLVPQHAANWDLIMAEMSPIRNVRLGSPGSVGTPANVGQGSARLPLLWMPRLDDQILWDSDGQDFVAAGPWGDGSTFFFPPPVVQELGIDDRSNAGLGAWGCSAGSANYDGEG